MVSQSKNYDNIKKYAPHSICFTQSRHPFGFHSHFTTVTYSVLTICHSVSRQSIDITYIYDLVSRQSIDFAYSYCFFPWFVFFFIGFSCINIHLIGLNISSDWRGKKKLRIAPMWAVDLMWKKKNTLKNFSSNVKENVEREKISCYMYNTC